MVTQPIILFLFAKIGYKINALSSIQNPFTIFGQKFVFIIKISFDEYLIQRFKNKIFQPGQIQTLRSVLSHSQPNFQTIFRGNLKQTLKFKT